MVQNDYKKPQFLKMTRFNDQGRFFGLFHTYMKGATEEIFVKVTYYKKREGLGSPQWHFTMHIPQC